ncbi:unnamed protein product [Lampetra planeri]
MSCQWLTLGCEPETNANASVFAQQQQSQQQQQHDLAPNSVASRGAGEATRGWPWATGQRVPLGWTATQQGVGWEDKRGAAQNCRPLSNFERGPPRQGFKPAAGAFGCAL